MRLFRGGMAALAAAGVCAAAGLGGCGDIVPAGITADDADAGSELDAAPTSGEVTVTVLDRGEPRSFQPVFVHDAEGSPVKEVQTDADGIVVIPDVPIGGYVTAAGSRSTSNVQLKSVGGLQPGDQLTLSIDTIDPTIPVDSQHGTVDLTLPDSPPTPTAVTKFDVRHTCRYNSIMTAPINDVAPGTMVQLAISEKCADAPSIDVIALGYNDAGDLLVTTHLVGVPLDHSANPLASAALPAPAAPGTATLTAPGINNVSGNLILEPRRGPGGLQPRAGTAYPASTSLDHPIATGYIDSVRGYLSIEPNAPEADEKSHTELREDASGLTPSGSQNFTLQQPMPFLLASATQVTEGDGYTVSYAAGAPLECGDLGPAQAVQVNLRGTANGTTYSWLLLAPATDQAALFPILSPTANALFFPRQAITLVHVDVAVAAAYPGTYSHFKYPPQPGVGPNTLTREVGQRGCISSFGKALP